MLKKTSETTPANTNNSGQGRRSFLAKLGIGAAALTAVSVGLVRFGRKPASNLAQELPGPTSIFHPAQDPRLDPRRNG